MPATDYTKDPASTVQYIFDRSDYLISPAKITASTWEVPADLTKVADEFDDTTTRITLTDGKVNNSYAVYNLITTDDGFTLRLAFLLKVIDAALIQPPTDLEKQLDAVRVALGEKAANGTEEYQIANRMKRRYSFADLLEYEKRLTELVNAERRRNGGAGFFKNHYVRPVEPGP